jgi:oxygen-dependent protoporphyrinogen oxidase
MDVGFAKDIIFTYKDSPEAGNRFVYYPDRLVKMPGGGQGFYELMKSLITEPVFKGAWKTPMHELLAPGRDESLVDESVSSFFNRRFGSPDVTNNIISAVIHGIYAGDIDQLSVKSLFRSLWDLEQKDRSLLRGAILRQGAGAVTPEHVYDMIAQLASLPKPNVWSTLRESAATYTFKDGMQTIPNNLKMWLRTRPNCEFMMGEKVTRVEHKIDVDGIMASLPVPPRPSR